MIVIMRLKKKYKQQLIYIFAHNTKSYKYQKYN